MKNTLFTFILLLSYGLMFSQESNELIIKTVYKESPEEVIGSVNVVFDDGPNGTAGDENGIFKISKNELDKLKKITISALGFKDVILTKEVIPTTTIVEMVEDPASLDEVNVDIIFKNPIDAYPIIQKFENKKVANYSSGWTYANFELEQYFIDYSSHNGTKKFMGSIKTYGKIQFKATTGYDNDLYFTIDSLRTTDGFVKEIRKKYSSIEKEVFKGKGVTDDIQLEKILNLYSFFTRYDIYRYSSYRKNKFWGTGLSFNRRVRKIVGFDFVNDEKNYLVRTNLVRNNGVSQVAEQLSRDERNLYFATMKKDVYDPNWGPKREGLAMAKINTKDFGMIDVYYKKTKFTESGDPYNIKNFRIEMTKNDGKYLLDRIQALYSTQYDAGVLTSKSAGGKSVFKEYQMYSDFKIINPEYSKTKQDKDWKPISKNYEITKYIDKKPLDIGEEKKYFYKEIRKRTFIKGSRDKFIKGENAVDLDIVDEYIK